MHSLNLTYQLMHFYTLQHVLIIIQITFRELVGSLLVTEFKNF